ncbi:hypothetical protein [Gelidibacter pelagius]|uniref:Uncharacterized protein n=1 Tax=Gelidibacter pelagius TaxID=2819985 RepID=A0ABS3SRF2_9FLAO|nr:hypothetical protein [Gelidibacter pelagius]MBO3098278.1 hypothetical protein [Gelidibacter pelagius]
MQLINTEHSFSFYNKLLSAKEPDNEFDINQFTGSKGSGSNLNQTQFRYLRKGL